MGWMKKAWMDFCRDESGMGVVEIILIIVVLIAMVLIFKNQITALVNNIWKSINQSAKKIYYNNIYMKIYLHNLLIKNREEFL